NDERLTNNAATIERLFCEYSIRIENHFHCFLKIRSCLLHRRPLCVCAGQLLDECDVAFRHFFKDRSQLHCHDYSLPSFYIERLPRRSIGITVCRCAAALFSGRLQRRVRRYLLRTCFTCSMTSSVAIPIC